MIVQVDLVLLQMHLFVHNIEVYIRMVCVVGHVDQRYEHCGREAPSEGSRRNKSSSPQIELVGHFLWCREELWIQHHELNDALELFLARLLGIFEHLAGDFVVDLVEF